MHNYHLLVEGIFDIHFYHRISETSGHVYAVGAVLGDEVLSVRLTQPAAAVSSRDRNPFGSCLRESVADIIVRRRAGLKKYQACYHQSFHAFRIGFLAAAVSSGRPIGALCGAP